MADIGLLVGQAIQPLQHQDAYPRFGRIHGWPRRVPSGHRATWSTSAARAAKSMCTAISTSGSPSASNLFTVMVGGKQVGPDGAAVGHGGDLLAATARVGGQPLFYQGRTGGIRGALSKSMRPLKATQGACRPKAAMNSEVWSMGCPLRQRWVMREDRVPPGHTTARYQTANSTPDKQRPFQYAWFSKYSIISWARFALPNLQMLTANHKPRGLGKTGKQGLPVW